MSHSAASPDPHHPRRNNQEPDEPQPTSPAAQQITLEQLEADIAAAEDLHQTLSARLDSIARD